MSSWEGLYPTALIFNNISRLLPWGADRCFVFRVWGNRPAPKVLANDKHEEVAPWAGVRDTKGANRVVPKENNAECSQPAAA